VQWPHGNQCAAAFTFDEDGECVAFGYDPVNARRRLSLQSEATYGPDVGLPRILDLLDSRGVRATFFVPGYTAERHRGIVADAARRGHEVAHHGYLHERPDLLDEDAEREALKKGSEILGEITGKKPRGYRAPSWEMSERTPGLLRENGLVYDSSLMGDDEPYSVPARGEERLLEIPVHWTNDDWVHFGFCSSPPLGNGISSPSKVYETWQEEFRGYCRYGGCFVLTMHPFVIGRPSRMRLLERMISLIQGTEKVWIATLEQIADYVAETGQGKYRPRADMSG
jgi:peptidoglycan-N-acetylglucosamine deacetylase